MAEGEEPTVSDLVELVKSQPGGDPIDAIIARELAGGGTQATNDPLIGVPEGFSVEGFTPGDSTEAMAARATGARPGGPATFRESHVAEIASWPPQKRARLVLAMMRSGAIDGSVNPNYWTSDISQVLGEALAFANMNGIDDPYAAVSTYGQVRTSARSTGKEFEAPARLAPDYATLAQDVKGYVRQRLGREVDDYELQQLTGEMTGFYADEYEARVELARMEHEQATTPGVQAPGVVQAVDPVSRFKQVFDQRYAGEIKTVERREEFEREAPRATSIIESGLA